MNESFWEFLVRGNGLDKMIMLFLFYNIVFCFIERLFCVVMLIDLILMRKIWIKVYFGFFNLFFKLYFWCVLNYFVNDMLLFVFIEGYFMYVFGCLDVFFLF